MDWTDLESLPSVPLSDEPDPSENRMTLEPDGFDPAVYTREFYLDHHREAIRQAQELYAKAIYEVFHPRWVLDVGCGPGWMLSALQARGVNVRGLEAPWATDLLTNVPIARCDLREPWSFGQKFDVVTCFEVGEHLPAQYSADLVRRIVKHVELSGAVLFSAAIPSGSTPAPGTTGHLTERSLGYWQAMFAELGWGQSQETTNWLKEYLGQVPENRYVFNRLDLRRA